MSEPKAVGAVGASQIELVDEGGGQYVRVSGGLLSSASVDVYCGEVRRETIQLSAQGNGTFRGGPVAPCTSGQMLLHGNLVSLEGMFKGLDGEGRPSGKKRCGKAAAADDAAPAAAPPPADAPVPAAAPPASSAPAAPSAQHAVSADPRGGFAPAPAVAANTALPHRFSRRIRAQGEADLRGQCNSSPVEDSFLYVEGKDARGRTVSWWYEVGTEEKADAVKTELTSDFVRGTQAEFAEVMAMSHYHFHPKNSPHSYGSEYPTPPDFEHAMKMGLERSDSRMGYPAGKFDVRVVTTVGTYTFKPNFQAIQADPVKAAAMIPWYQQQFTAFMQGTTTSYASMTPVERCRSFAMRVTNLFVMISFQPA